ncbi:MAG: multidrug effflux MFS transporter [Alphaproteobacteria bacterium]
MSNTVQVKHKRSPLFIISLLGALSVVSPFAIDMYLPAFLQVAQDFSVSTAMIPLTVAAYFIGLASGQLFYGPLLDRYGRKKPLTAGLAVFILSSVGCALAQDMNTLILMRFIQGLGGCVAQIASIAMVRDFFPAKDTARIISRLILFISVSPMLAPSIGNLVINLSGWRAVFIMLMVVVIIILSLTTFLLPEGHKPDKSISLKPWPIIKEYGAILKHPRFSIYAIAGSFSFAGLFIYVAGSPIIFMEGFQLSPEAYSGLFALLATGFIGGSQLNVWLLKRFTSQQLFLRVLIIQTLSGLAFVIGTVLGWYDLIGTAVLFYIFLSGGGIAYPNAAALALTPFTKNVGSASALLGFIQLGLGSFISAGVSAANMRGSLPIVIILAVTAIMGLTILLLGKKRAEAAPLTEDV